MRSIIPTAVLFVMGSVLLALSALPKPACVMCTAELRSWQVFTPHPGRHLYLQIECPEGYRHLNGRVEYTSTALRSDYRHPADLARVTRVARMTRGAILVPFFGDVTDTRLEGRYVLTVGQVWCLQRDRIFETEYQLIGPNSSSGLRAAMEECGCTVPEEVLAETGWLGEFPGIGFDPGREIEAEDWPWYGIAAGPAPLPGPSREDVAPEQVMLPRQ